VSVSLWCPSGIGKRLLAVLVALAFPIGSVAAAQDAASKPAKKGEETTASPPASKPPAQIELLETRIRFESNGDSHKEVHTSVLINNELGARQFGQLKFDYNRGYQTVDIPLVRIKHASGGTAEILPRAIADAPNPAAANYPAYHDVRVKSVRILGLAPGDHLEYRVITSTAHHPLAPEFWLEHSFDRTGIVTEEIFELDLPQSRPVTVSINRQTSATSVEKRGALAEGFTTYRWRYGRGTPAAPGDSDANAGGEPDVVVSTFPTWDSLSEKLAEKLGRGPGATSDDLRSKALELTKSAHADLEKLEAIYDFVSQKIATVGLPLGSTGFRCRPAEQVLSSGYATPEDKSALFAALVSAPGLRALPALAGYCDSQSAARPSVFTRVIISTGDAQNTFWLDPSLEVAPFGIISPLPKKCAFLLGPDRAAATSVAQAWQPIRGQLPFPAFQRVTTEATLASDGKLLAKLHYTIRGDNELLLRLAFHQTPREQWSDVAQLLAISDGFRGKITSARASDPLTTREPFSVEYEIVQLKFADWSKKIVHIPAILPLLGLPEPPAKSASSNSSPIELGSPLEVTTQASVRVPAGATIEAPPGTSVERDYASFRSRYNVENGTITATRHISFRTRELPAERSADYHAFVRAVQNDQAQLFTITLSDATSAATPSRPAAEHKASKP